VDGAPDGACGGSVFAHIAYERQRQIKSAIVEDAFRRIGRITLESPAEVVASPVDGYRMRARLHVRNGRIGFFREGTHSLCDAASTRQLRDDTIEVIRRLEASLAGEPRQQVNDVEIAENIDASQRAIHLELLANADPSRLATLARVDGVDGASCAHPENTRTIELYGSPIVSDAIGGATLSRHVRSFFQGNRYLLEPFVAHVISHVTTGPLVDLYAGVGLFSLAAQQAAHAAPITAVEGDLFAARDLTRNAHGGITVLEMPVERYRSQSGAPATVIVDPPRTGMSKEALARAIELGAPAFVYVSCDVATLARDARVLIDAGYQMRSLRAFDMFPNTAHVETVVAFAR
jgi:23S rRNA (uracil1939-C5)-methyltransferase